jgi:hypothetical protein
MRAARRPAIILTARLSAERARVFILPLFHGRCASRVRCPSIDSSRRWVIGSRSRLHVWRGVTKVATGFRRQAINTPAVTAVAPAINIDAAAPVPERKQRADRRSVRAITAAVSITWRTAAGADRRTCSRSTCSAPRNNRHHARLRSSRARHPGGEESERDEREEQDSRGAFVDRAARHRVRAPTMTAGKAHAGACRPTGGRPGAAFREFGGEAAGASGNQQPRGVRLSVARRHAVRARARPSLIASLSPRRWPGLAA